MNTPPDTQADDSSDSGFHFASVIDRNYLLPYAAMLRSFRAHNPDVATRAYLLHYELVDDDFEYLGRVSEALNIPMETIRIPSHPFELFTVRRRSHINAQGTMSPIAYAKAFLDRFLPEDADKIICIDADIVITDDMSGVPRCNGEFPLLAVANLPRNHHHQFNSGFMVADLGEWRRIGVADIAERFLMDYSDTLHTHDQHVLNLIFQNRWKRIGLKWNYMEDFYRHMKKSRTYQADEIQAARQHPAVVHFAVGTDKPWREKSDHPRAHLYREHVSALARFRDGLKLIEPGGG